MESINNVTNNIAVNRKGDEKVSVLDVILVSRYFLPLLSSLAFILMMIFNPKGGSPLESVLVVTACIGWLSALTVSPLKMIMFVLKSIATGFKICRGFIPFYGIADLVAATVGVGLGLVFALVVLVFAPAAFTIPKLFAED